MIKALYFSDNTDVTGIDIEYIKKYGNIEVAVFNDSEKAVDYLEKNADCIIFYEHPNPNCKLWCFLRELKHAGVGAAFVVITAEDNCKTISTMYKNGVSAVLVRPYDYDAFSSLLKYFEAQINNHSTGKISEHFWISMSRVFAGQDSDLADKVLEYLEGQSACSKKISDELNQPAFLVNQCLNELVSSGKVESTAKKTEQGIIKRIFSIKH